MKILALASSLAILAAIGQSALAQDAVLQGAERTRVFEQTRIKVIEPDQRQIDLLNAFGFDIGGANATKCYWCTGNPKTCDEIKCDEIVIVNDAN